MTVSPKLHFYLHQPTALFKARVNMASITYPVTALTYDTVILGAFGDVHPDMTLTLGTTEGADDAGRVRAQNFATATSIPLGRVSQGTEDGTLDVYDNYYVTVWADFRVWAKLPYITPAGVTYKDADIAVLTYMTEIPPVANCGPGTAGTIDTGTSLLTVAFSGLTSYAMADGATITTYLWDVKDGTITVGTTATSTITATFPAGFRWVGLTVTDSNGKVHTTRCPVLAVNPANDATVESFRVESHRITQQGQTLSVRILEDAPRTTYPDGCLVLFWYDEPLSSSDRNHMKFIGWHQSDSASIRATKTGNLRDTVLNCVDVAGRLDVLPGFAQALERVTPSTDWAHMPGLTMDRALHYLMFWHSTAPSLADFTLSGTGSTYSSMRLDSSGASLYDQMNSRALSMVPDHVLTCNVQGQMQVRADWMYKNYVDRPAVTQTLTEDDWSEMRVEYHRPPRVHVLRSSAVVASTSWLVIGGEDTLPLAFSIAPGDTFGQGVSEAVEAEGLTISQAALNAATGHRYARLNARYGLFNISEPSGDIWAYEPALMQRVQLNISAATAAQRGLDSTTLVGMVKEISLRYNTDKTGTWIAPSLTWEREVVGLPAQTVTPVIPGVPDYSTPPPGPETTPPDMGLIGGQELVAGIGIDGYVYRTSDFQTASGSGGPTWTRVDTTIADTIYSFVVDPFSPGYAPGATAGAINGWIANDTGIYQVADLFGTATATLVHTFTTSTVAASYHWRSIQASFGAYFAAGVNPWLLCISYYGSTAGHTGTWATYSTDGGVTWAAEVLVSAFYDNGVATRFNPIGVYTSPKTPGLAYTAAYTETSSPALADGYVSTDWGATWTRVSTEVVDDPAQPSPVWAVWPDGGSFTPGASASTFAEAYEAAPVDGGGAGGATEVGTNLIIIPPKTTKRLEVAGTWVATRDHTGGSSSTSGSVAQTNHATVARVGDDNYATPANPGTATGSYAVTYTFTGGDWPVNLDDYLSSPPAAVADCGARADIFCSANAITGSNHARMYIQVSLRVTEIELDSGLIYQPSDYGAGMIQPGHAQAGSIHLPWPTNADESVSFYGNFDKAGFREFRLKRTAGTVITDVSPVAGGRSYGVNRYGFAARTYDSNRQYVLASVIGNDLTSLPADDFHGVYISSDNGDTWTQVVAPIADSGAPTGRPAFEAAFGGDSEQILFVWGAPNFIKYSADFGVTLLDKVGNLATFGTASWCGIAGGPG